MPSGQFFLWLGPPRAARRHDAMSHLDHLHTFIEAYRLSFLAGRRTPGHDPAGSVPAHPGAGSLRRQAAVPAAGARRHPTDAAHELARAVGPMLDGLQARRPATSWAATCPARCTSPAPPTSSPRGWPTDWRRSWSKACGSACTPATANASTACSATPAPTAVTASLPDERAHGYARLLTERFQLVLAPRWRPADKRALAAGLASLPLIAYDEDLPLVRPVWNAMFRLPRLAGGHDHRTCASSRTR